MGNLIGSAAIDAFFKGKAYGPVATRLMANGMNPAALRTNDTLRHEEWQTIDKAIVPAATKRLTCVSDLTSRGLVYNIPNGIGKTVLAYEDMSDISDAAVDMDAAVETPHDRPDFGINYLPLPIIHKDWHLNIRALNASRNGDTPLDTTMAELAAQKVAQMAEELLVNGGANLSFGGGTIYGYTDYPKRNEVDLATNWDDSAMTGALIRDDVLSMKQASLAGLHYGPWILYVPQNYETVLDEDYSTQYPNQTIRDRILKIDGIQDCKVSDHLADNNVVLVELDPLTARMVIGLDIQNVEWESKGGMVFHYKVLAISVPQLRCDQNSKCGLVHLH